MKSAHSEKPKPPVVTESIGSPRLFDLLQCVDPLYTFLCLSLISRLFFVFLKPKAFRSVELTTVLGVGKLWNLICHSIHYIQNIILIVPYFRHFRLLIYCMSTVYNVEILHT